MAIAKQADRLMQFSSPLGKDVLLIESLDGAEGISRLFEYQVTLLADTGATIDPKSMIGAKVAVSIVLNDKQGSRWINGIVSSFEQYAGDTEFNIYKARIVPSMWQLTLSSNCRIYQNKTVLDIVKSVVAEYGLSLSDQTSASYKQLEYCTQYSESDFHFVSRILEESGIFYWFEHTDQDNKLMLGDGRNAYQDCPISASFPYQQSKSGAEGSYGAWVNEFTAKATMVSGKHSTAEYNYKDYAREDVSDVSSASPYGKNAFDDYQYPAGAEGYAGGAPDVSKSLETLFLQTRATAADSVAELFPGESNARSFCPGYTFTLTANPQKAWNRKYLLTEVTHHADQVPSYLAADTKDDAGYSNKFTAISSDLVFKPLQTVAKPRIYGPQTAVVVGESGDEILIDSQGRIKVRFFWDKLNSDSSTVDCTWVRVAQGWAGNGWGSYFWPRVKDEVVINFLNGDPDNPIITGSVYNGVNTPPHPLPDNKTRSGILTRSSQGGSASTANELWFEDKSGSEMIGFHAEKDMEISIEHDRVASVGNNDSLTVTTNQTEKIGSNYHINIGSNRVEQIGSNSDISVGSNRTESVGSNDALTVGSNQSISVGSAYSLNANNTVYINAGMSCVIQAGVELSLVCAGNFVTIGPSGVAISGTMVLINSGGAAGSGSAGQTGNPASPNAPDATKYSDASGGGAFNPAAPIPAATLPSISGAQVSTVTGAAQGAVIGAMATAVQGEQQVVGDAKALATQAQQQVQQVANQAQQFANQAQQAAQQAQQQAQQAFNSVVDQAKQTVQQAQNAVQQAEQTVNSAAAQGRAAAQGALNQAQQQLNQCKQAAASAVQQAQQQAQQVEQQAQQAANQAKQAAQQAQQQAQQAANQGKQAAQQAEQQAQQAANQAKQAAQQAQQQAQQAANQVKGAASQAQQQASQAAQGAQQSASQAVSQATRGF
ncbi:MAG: type VI secretion system tip protein TssI/VgrG [Terracidiphilus sp.]|jgi:type VI secretion system secreted protein VgrG